MNKASALPNHLATLNLFRNADGTLNVTIAEARGAGLEVPHQTGTLYDYVMARVREAVIHPSQREFYDSFSAMRNDLNEMFGNMQSQESTLLNGPEMGPECEDVVTAMRAVAQHLADADGIIFELVAPGGHMGELHHKGERYLKAHRPDLYDRIGQGVLPEPNPEPED